MSFLDSVKRAGGNLIHDAEHAGSNLVHGTANVVKNTTNFVNDVDNKINQTVKRGITNLAGKATVIGKGLINGTEFIGGKIADGSKKVAAAAVQNLQFQGAVTRVALEKTLDGAKVFGSLAADKLKSITFQGDPNPPAAQGLKFSETKSATNLAYDAKQGEVYRFPDGKTWQVADVSEDKSSGFRAIALKPTDPNDRRTIVSFAGTDPKSGKDWVTDLGQGAGFKPKQYSEAVDFANKWKAIDGDNVTLTGHSLGGGLASYASIQTGLRATALNSAPLALNHLGGNPLSPSVRNNPRITQYYVPSEILTDIDGANPLDMRPGNKIAVQGKYPTFTLDPISDTAFSIMNHMGGSAAPGIPDPVKIN